MITRSSIGRSVVTSIFTTALDFGTLLGLVALHLDYVVATFLGTVVGFLANFTINRYWAFDAAQGSVHGQFVRVLPVQAGSTALQTAGVWLFAGVILMRLWLAKLVVSALVYAIWNYPMNRFWVFRSKVGRPVIRISVELARSGSPDRAAPPNGGAE